MRVLLTGVGLLGVQIVRTLARHGHQVVAVDVRPRDVDLLAGVWNDQARFAQVDITDGAALARLAREARIDGIVHTAVLMNEPASRADPVRSFRINVEGTLNILEIARELGVRTVCMSSQSVYGSRPTLEPIAVDDIRPWLGSLYASEKVMCEVLLNSYRAAFGVDAVIFRPNQMYGPAPTQFRTVLDQMLVKVLRGEAIVSPSGGDFQIAWTYAPDMAEAIVRALERPTLQSWIFNVEEGRLRSVRELGDIIQSLVPGSSIKIGPGTTMPGFSLPPARGMGDSRPVRQELELVSTPFPDGVRACVDWLRANPGALPTSVAT